MHHRRRERLHFVSRERLINNSSSAHEALVRFWSSQLLRTRESQRKRRHACVIARPQVSEGRSDLSRLRVCGKYRKTRVRLKHPCRFLAARFLASLALQVIHNCHMSDVILKNRERLTNAPSAYRVLFEIKVAREKQRYLYRFNRE